MSHFICDAKHDGHYKARLEAGAHLTNTTLSTEFSRVVPSKGIILVLIATELNVLEQWGQPYEVPA